MTRNRTGTVCKWGLGILALTVIIGYAIFNSRVFIAGPQLQISSPTSGDTISDSPLVKLEGTARNISYISANDRSFSIDSENKFNQSILLKPGYNNIYIEARDKFGRSIEENLELFYTGSTPEIVPEEENITESLEEI